MLRYCSIDTSLYMGSNLILSGIEKTKQYAMFYFFWASENISNNSNINFPQMLFCVHVNRLILISCLA